MIYLLIIPAVLAYATIAAATFRTHGNDLDNPVPVFAGILWPIVLVWTIVFTKPIKLGLRLGARYELWQELREAEKKAKALPEPRETYR